MVFKKKAAPMKKTGKKDYSSKQIVRVVKKLALKEDRKDAKVYRPSAVSAGLVTSTAGGTYMLNNIAQGDNDNQRNGNKITLLRVKMQGEISLPTTTTVANMNDIVRIIVFKDKQCNGVQATVTSILDSANIFSFYNEDNIPENSPRRFTIYYDKFHSINASGVGFQGTYIESGTTRKVFQLDKKLNVPVQFNSTTGAITEQNSNTLGLLVISLQGAMYVDWNTEVSFCDAEGL